MACWAPVLLQPVPGSEERIVIAIAAVGESETRCMQTIDPSIVAAVFREDRKYAVRLLELVVESVREHLTHSRSLSAWNPPVQGVLLGSEQRTALSDIDELIRRAGAMSSVFCGPYFKPPSDGAGPTGLHAQAF